MHESIERAQRDLLRVRNVMPITVIPFFGDNRVRIRVDQDVERACRKRSKNEILVLECLIFILFRNLNS